MRTSLSFSDPRYVPDQEMLRLLKKEFESAVSTKYFGITIKPPVVYGTVKHRVDIDQFDHSSYIIIEIRNNKKISLGYVFIHNWMRVK